MTTTTGHAHRSLWQVWPALAALLTAIVLLVCAGNNRAADPVAAPTPEEQVRYLEWYKKQAAQKASPEADATPTREDVQRLREWYSHNGAPQSISSAASKTLTGPTPQEVTRFVEWYKRAGAPRPSGTAPPPPTPDDVVRFLAWYRRNGAPTPSRALTPDERPANSELVACYLEAYRHHLASIPHTPLPVVVPFDVHPVSEEVARFVEWYKREGAPRPTGAAPPPARDDVARFLAWYRHNGAPTPTAGAASVQLLTNAEAARFLEAYRHNGAPTPHAAPLPVVAQVNVKPVPTAKTPAQEVARFVEWYKREGAPQPSGTAPPPPTPADVVRFLAWHRRNGAPTPISRAATDEQPPTNDEIARYLDAYRHSGVPALHPLPVVTKLDVQSGYDPNVRPVVAQESAPPVVIVQAPQPTEVRPPNSRPNDHSSGSGTALLSRPNGVSPTNGSGEPSHVQEVPGPRASANLIPVPPPPPLPMAPPKATQTVTATPPAPLPPALTNSPSAPSAPVTPIPTAAVAEPPILTPFDAILQQVGCSSCGTGGGLLSAHGPGDDGPISSAAGCNCGAGGCIPGRLHQCSPCEADTVVGRFLCGVYQCICCPDPCYDPHWIPIADAAFFTESARPQTQQSLGWDAGRNLMDPDRAEYFWARADGKGAGPNPANHANPNGYLGENNVNYNDLWLYTEAALGNIGTFVYVPYRSLDGELVGHAAGFSDVQVGTKTLLFDCELLQIAFEFRTFIPAGSATKGLGTGHVSLEPGLIVGLKVGPETYFQGQVEEWIPLGGDTDYEGALVEYHLSMNQVLYRILPDVPLVGTAELSGWSFQHGLFTDPVLGPGQRATGGTYIALGPGLRLFICDKIDFGIGTAFAVTERHFADQLFRTEFRWRF